MNTNQQPHVLLVENASKTHDSLKLPLTMAGFKTIIANNSEDTDTQLAAFLPKLILLDSSLPNLNAVSYIKKLRSHDRTSHIPIISIITPTTARQDQLLSSLADDYVIKPFSDLALIAKMHFLLQKPSANTNQDIITIRDLSFNLRARKMTIAGNPVKLTPMNYALLAFFICHPNEIHSRRQIAEKVWYPKLLSEHAVDVHIRQLRKLLRQHHYDYLIQTVHRVGFLFSADNHR